MIPLDIRSKHDSLGNCPELLSIKHKQLIDQGNFIRASGDCICEICGKNYYSHPVVIGALWLNEMCDGTLVKL